MPRIHQLRDQLISQIAAGEVVERPSSVVKELVENALDAGATAVRVELEAGGKRRIVVSDDGIGMDRDDALLAFDRHATSKITTFDDLERVATLGFRGEALASIAAVARVEMLTAERPGDGQRVRIEGGRVLVAEPAARARGTTLEIASLFFNVPARRKFLRTPETELRRALEVVQGYALARPEIGFTVAHDGRTLLDAPPATGAPGDLVGARARIAQVFGATLAADLVPIAGDGRGISGFVGTPATARGRRQSVFVNRRLVRDRAILAAFYRAVRDEWRSEDFPALFLFLDLPPEDVDVNVHPQKAEVRFRDPGVSDRVYFALRRALATARGEEDAPLRTPSGDAGPLGWEGLGARSGGDSSGAPSWSEPAFTGEARSWTPGGAPHEVREPSPQALRLAEVAYAPLDRPAFSLPGSLPGASSGPLAGRGKGPTRFRLLGQYKATLILLEGPDGLYLIDQHVAHERILYERLRSAIASAQPPVQRLLQPILLELAPAESLRLATLAPHLEPVGFEIGELSGGTLALSAVPAVLGVAEAEKLVMTLASTAGSERATEPADVAREILEALAASEACKAAIKMHHPLSAPAMEALVSELFAADQPYACPHGRPIVLQMTDGDLERRFGRR